MVRLMSTGIPAEGFVALAAVAWADGRMSKTEATGLINAAKAAGLEGDALARVEASTKEKVEITAFDASALAPMEKALVYALASWLARCDGVTAPAERAALQQLGDELGLAKDQLQSAAAGAMDIAIQPQGSKPDKYDFQALTKRLGERLPSLSGSERRSKVPG